MSRFSITKKDGSSLSKDEIKTFYLHLSVICMKLGYYVNDNEELSPSQGVITAEDLQISSVNPNCEVCDD
tara:strand:- start:355 stop:564 length:210 start_codon:yes stop_codon:yes gene_type:complete